MPGGTRFRLTNLSEGEPRGSRRPPFRYVRDYVSDQSMGHGYWMASDGKWYPPEQHPDYLPPPPPSGAIAAPPPVTDAGVTWDPSDPIPRPRGDDQPTSPPSGGVPLLGGPRRLGALAGGLLDAPIYKDVVAWWAALVIFGGLRSVVDDFSSYNPITGESEFTGVSVAFLFELAFVAGFMIVLFVLPITAARRYLRQRRNRAGR